MLSKIYYFNLFFIFLIFYSCALEKKEFDNPVDFEANDDLGVKAPTIVFYPLRQIKALTDSIIIESYVVFKEDSMEDFSGVHLEIEFPQDLLELDTIIPGVFITDTNKSVPLFNYIYDESKIDIYTYFLDTLKFNIQGTGHIASLVFKSITTGSDSVYYNLENCELINSSDETIQLNGKRSAEIIIE